MKEAIRVVLTPVDTGQLYELGWKVTSSEIRAGSFAGEKRELKGAQLREGQEVTIDYRLEGRPAKVTYSVKDVQPPGSYVGKGSVVEIRTERQNKKSPFSATLTDRVLRTEQRKYVRYTMQGQLQFLQEDLRLAMAAGLPVDYLQTQIRSLEESLESFF